jgi:hypothetical protein
MPQSLRQLLNVFRLVSQNVKNFTCPLRTTPPLSVHRMTRSVAPTLFNTAQPYTANFEISSLTLFPRTPLPTPFKLHSASLTLLVRPARCAHSRSVLTSATSAHHSPKLTRVLLYTYVPHIIPHTRGTYLTDMLRSLLVHHVSIPLHGLPLLKKLW